MSIVILIPCLICIVGLFYWSLTKTFLNVYLTVFMLIPTYFFWKVAALPPINFSEAVLVPLCIAILIKELPRWRWTVADLALPLFIISSYYAEYLLDMRTNAIFDGFNTVALALTPYMIGKTLIEQHGARVATVKRFTFLLFLGCILALYEYPMGRNPYSMIWQPLFPDESFSWKTQIRWGFGRVSGPFGQSELAGMVLFTGLVFAIWLLHRQQWEPRFKGLEWTPVSKPFAIIGLLVITLLMTQARGPWLGCLAALPVLFVGRAKNVKRTAKFAFVGIALFGAIAYSGLKNYVSDGAPASDEQQTAQYRSQLLDNYAPIAREGGLWGWGDTFPQVPGQGSIDNEYLFIALTQGFAGLAALCLLGVSTVIRLAYIALNAPNRDDSSFAFALLGIFIGLLGTITTVFLGNQPYELLFLLAGWAQAIPMPQRVRQSAFQFQQVYT
ncbi:O-Antigen ligase [Bryocella elongata]|uniref:O-Antigen ligase n=1 Tax=Bryocella elongata TaxID=863522 RepID=A0A1H6AW08_9BACT|nr:O-antigen ligase family protein [Bryocella elongata]SEG52400.1 O-Antigen ligase [Bryocella elongata]